MNTESIRRNAEHCFAQASKTTDETQRQRYLRAATAWTSLAGNKETIDGALLNEEPQVIPNVLRAA
jgi:hypothetical protein